MAIYNAWMNEKVYSATAKLSDEERKLDRGAFFGSIHRTLNHILWADLLWLARMKGDPLPEIGGVDAVLHEGFEDLWSARRKTDEAIRAWTETIDDASLDTDLTIHSRATGSTLVCKRRIALMQIFNHQTHHRGQITTLLTQAGVDVGVTDLPRVPEFQSA
ncbi:MAG: damage-inducible protein DinB [Myxococcales bacterium]|nr:damage-inducible protein DinB [Myxococcales bacterium]